MTYSYDLIVIGAGHAGCEASAAAASMSARTLLISMDMAKFAFMSCNPAMGGVAKGQILREIDALGGYAALVTDRSMIQYRLLNRSKGPAMWSPRAQSDRMKFSIEWRKILEDLPFLDFWQDSVRELLIKGGRIYGVRTSLGQDFYAKKVILTAGTFLNGLMHVGMTRLEGGRMSEPASKGISEQLKEHGIEVGRMKTGTPARLDGRSIDFSKLEEQKGDQEGRRFTYLDEFPDYSRHRSCYIAYTNERVHRVLEGGFKSSPLFSGRIEGVGPRYCPSIEDKLLTFSDKPQHQLFLEPEGFDTIEYYLNGFSSSLPWDVQYNALREIEGLEQVKIFRPGYAIEYDFYPPVQLWHSLESKTISNLYFAGQVNGTTGYEEAAAQGLLAGINAISALRNRDPLVLKRDESYIGVLIDDLVTKGVDEPYRMFTSRAEFRLLLRQDNADERLTRTGRFFGLVSDRRYDLLESKIRLKKEIIDYLQRNSADPGYLNSWLMGKGTSELRQRVKLIDLVKRPQVSLLELKDVDKGLMLLYRNCGQRAYEIFESTEIELKYEGYISRERDLASKVSRLDGLSLPDDFDYNKVTNLSTEGRQKLIEHRPGTIGQASRLSGVTPSDINVLLVYIGR